MTNIIANKIQCTVCSAIIESNSVHDYVVCPCGSVAVDGGKNYLRRNGTTYVDLSVTTDEPFELQRSSFKWKSYGKLGNEPGRWTALKDLTREHIEAILETQWHIRGSYVEDLFKKELEYRDSGENNGFI